MSEEKGSRDRIEDAAVARIRDFLNTNRDQVFSSRQIEVLFEDEFFHWISHRALKILADRGEIGLEQRNLSYGAPINVVWHKSNRYTRRQIKELMGVVEQYSHSDFTAALGNTGELLVSDGFSRFGFVQRGRNVRAWQDRRWVRTEHNLDFLWEKDGEIYGVEVKNTLAYIDDKELRVKLELCAELRVVPVFVVRSLPAIWIQEIVGLGGFALILKYHLYPFSHRVFAEHVKSKLRLPVDAPRALYDGTMLRFVRWHERRVQRFTNPELRDSSA